MYKKKQSLTIFQVSTSTIFSESVHQIVVSLRIVVKYLNQKNMALHFMYFQDY